MKACLDTNTYVAFKRNDRDIVEFLECVDSIFVPAIVLGELYAGFYQGSRAKENMEELVKFLNVPGVSVLNVNTDIADRYGQLVRLLREQGTPIPTNDVWIAATAFEMGTRLVTYDKHFKNIPDLIVYPQ